MMSVPPRPCLRRRISFKRPRSDGVMNCVKKVMEREILTKRDRAFSSADALERFRNMRLVVCLLLLL